jgi:hypothetical protein
MRSIRRPEGRPFVGLGRCHDAGKAITHGELARTTAPIINIGRFAAGAVKNMKNVIACRLGGI